MESSTRQFRLLWFATALGAVADQCFLVSLPWLVLQLTGSGAALGTVLMAAGIARAALMLVGGSLSDRIGPRPLLLASSGGRTLLIGLAAALLGWGAARPWHCYVLALAIGALDGLYAPAVPSMVPVLARGRDLARANSRLQGTTQLAALLVPVIAGALIARAGLLSTFLVSAGAAGAAAVVYGLISPASSSERPAPEPGTSAPTTMAVIQAILRDRPLRALMWLSAAMSLAVVGPIGVGAPLLAAQRFGGSVGFGLMMSAAGGGTLAGMTAGGSLLRVRHRGVVLLLINAASGALLVLLGYATRLELAMVAIALMSAGSGFVAVVLTTSLQQIGDPSSRGRLMSVLMFASVAPTAVSYLVAGYLAARDPSVVFGVAGGLVLAITACAALSAPLRSID